MDILKNVIIWTPSTVLPYDAGLVRSQSALSHIIVLSFMTLFLVSDLCNISVLYILLWKLWLIMEGLGEVMKDLRLLVF